MGKSTKRVRIDTKPVPPRGNVSSSAPRTEPRAPKRGFEDGGPRMNEDQARSKLQKFFWKKGMLSSRKGSVSNIVIAPSAFESTTRLATAIDREERRVRDRNRGGDLEGENLFRGMQQQKVEAVRHQNPHRRPSSIGAVNLGAPTTAANDVTRRNARKREERLEARTRELAKVGLGYQDPAFTNVGIDHPGQTRRDDDALAEVEARQRTAKGRRIKTGKPAGAEHQKGDDLYDPTKARRRQQAVHITRAQSARPPQHLLVTARGDAHRRDTLCIGSLAPLAWRLPRTTRDPPRVGTMVTRRAAVAGLQRLLHRDWPGIEDRGAAHHGNTGGRLGRAIRVESPC